MTQNLNLMNYRASKGLQLWVGIFTGLVLKNYSVVSSAVPNPFTHNSELYQEFKFSFFLKKGECKNVWSLIEIIGTVLLNRLEMFCVIGQCKLRKTSVVLFKSTEVSWTLCTLQCNSI